MVAESEYECFCILLEKNQTYWDTGRDEMNTNLTQRLPRDTPKMDVKTWTTIKGVW